jgi:hypothetical protein
MANTETIADDFAALIQTLPDGLGVDVERELRLGFALELELAKQRQTKLAAFNHRHPRRAIEGIGQTMLSIDPVLRAMAERAYGKGCWQDRGFVREALRDNPDLRVPYFSAKTTVRVQGRRNAPRAAKPVQMSAPLPPGALIVPNGTLP